MRVKNLLPAKVKANLDAAIHAELFASNLYKHLANQLQSLGFFGAQKFFLAESTSELKHYQQIVDYQNDSGTVAKVPAVEAMNDVVTSLEDALKIAFSTEDQLGRDYLRWYGEADPVTQQFLLQFLAIQRKSVGEFGDLLARIGLAKGDNAGILQIDKELGEP
jgi:ferritin